MTDFDNLAKLIKESAKAREESWNNKGYGEYKLTIDQACDKIAKELNLGNQHTSIANLLLFTSWNDALDWADRQIYPIEMAYVEGCYQFVNKLYSEDFPDLSVAQTQLLINYFSEAAKQMRASLYGFGTD